VTASGLFFLLTVAFTVLPVQVPYLSSIWFAASVISYFVGWLALAIGAVWQLVDVPGFRVCLKIHSALQIVARSGANE